MDCGRSEREHTLNVLRDLLRDELTDAHIAALERACWDRARAIVTNPDDVIPVYVQSCRDAIANITSDSGLSNGNRYLTGAIRSTEVAPTRVPSMSASELRPGVRKEEPSRCCDDGADASRATDLFECPRCCERKCTHYELQTRSADEATTVFVSCVACGHKWTE